MGLADANHSIGTVFLPVLVARQLYAAPQAIVKCCCFFISAPGKESIIDSAPSLGVIIVNNRLRLSVCHAPSNCFFFVSRWNRAIFSRQFSMWHSKKRCSSIFDLDPLTPIIYSPKFCTKSPIGLSRLVWQIHRRCLGLLGGFRGWPIQWNRAKCCGTDPCCHDNEI